MNTRIQNFWQIINANITANTLELCVETRLSEELPKNNSSPFLPSKKSPSQKNPKQFRLAPPKLFAKPTRITATAYMGKAGIVNIEKEADMSGSIHDKGIQVLKLRSYHRKNMKE